MRMPGIRNSEIRDVDTLEDGEGSGGCRYGDLLVRRMIVVDDGWRSSSRA